MSTSCDNDGYGYKRTHCSAFLRLLEEETGYFIMEVSMSELEHITNSPYGLRAGC